MTHDQRIELLTRNLARATEKLAAVERQLATACVALSCTPETLATVAEAVLRTYRNSERELAALRDERERVLAVLLLACHSGVNLGEHTAVYKALREMGER